MLQLGSEGVLASTGKLSSLCFNWEAKVCGLQQVSYQVYASIGKLSSVRFNGEVKACGLQEPYTTHLFNPTHSMAYSTGDAQANQS